MAEVEAATTTRTKTNHLRVKSFLVHGCMCILLVLGSLGLVSGFPRGGPYYPEHTATTRGQYRISPNHFGAAARFEGGTLVHFERTFDSCRGYPGEGPGIPSEGRHISGGDRVGSHSAGYAGEFRQASGRPFSVPSRDRGRSGGECRFTRGGVRKKGGGVSLHVTSTTVAQTTSITDGIGTGTSRVDGDREALSSMSGHRESTGARRGQGFTFLGSQLREKAPSTWQLASGKSGAAADIRLSSREVQQNSDAVVQEEKKRRSTTEGLRERGLYGGEKRRRVSIVHRLPTAKQIRGTSEVPDGGRSGGGSTDPERRLRYARRSERRLFDSGPPPFAQKVLQVPVPHLQGTVPVEDGVVWHVGSSQDLHQNSSSHHWHSQVSGDTLSHIYRRLVAPRPGPGQAGKGDGDSDGAPATKGGSPIKAFKGKPSSLSTIHMLGDYLGHKTTNLPHTCKTHQGAAEFRPTTAEDARRSSSTHTGFGPFCGTSGFNFAGNPPGEEKAPPYSTRTREGSASRGMDRSMHPITRSSASSAVVGDRRAMASKRQLHCSASTTDSDIAAHGRRTTQASEG